jgi:molybdenum cofactor cytidylyltransferase
MVAAVILAAGRSSRMGRPKAQLRYVPTDDTFGGHLIRTAREARLDPIFVVLADRSTALSAEVERHGATTLLNEAPDRGQLSSILVGLDAADAAGASAVMIMPVDVPLLSPAVLEAVLAASAAEDAQIVRATHGGQHGHPVLFKRSVFDELRAADPSIGARAVVRANPARVRDVEVNEPGVTLDIDTPEDYRRAFGRDL